jgi:hypothetical protein
VKRTRNWNKSAAGKAYAKDYYRKYMPIRQKQNKDYLESVRRSSECLDCGETNAVLLQFHHRNGKEKYVIGMYTRWSLNRLKEEIAKCDVLCANCHIIRHHNEQTGYNAQRKVK